MSDLTSLISRLEAATDEQVCDADWLREVRTAIADACFDRSEKHRPSPQWWFHGFIGWQPLEDAPDWLHSVDASLTLKPASLQVSIWERPDGSGWEVTLAEWDHGPSGHLICEWVGKAATAAIAIVIACLKARAKLEASDDR